MGAADGIACLSRRACPSSSTCPSVLQSPCVCEPLCPTGLAYLQRLHAGEGCAPASCCSCCQHPPFADALPALPPSTRVQRHAGEHSQPGTGADCRPDGGGQSESGPGQVSNTGAFGFVAVLASFCASLAVSRVKMIPHASVGGSGAQLAGIQACMQAMAAQPCSCHLLARNTVRLVIQHAHCPAPTAW